jgi:hypothetical protein
MHTIPASATPAKRPTFYVHKLRLEAREGAHVEIRPLDLQVRPQQGGWILAKFIGASLAATSLLVLIAHQFAR